MQALYSCACRSDPLPQAFHVCVQNGRSEQNNNAKCESDSCRIKNRVLMLFLSTNLLSNGSLKEVDPTGGA